MASDCALRCYLRGSASVSIFVHFRLLEPFKLTQNRWRKRSPCLDTYHWAWQYIEVFLLRGASLVAYLLSYLTLDGTFKTGCSRFGERNWSLAGRLPSFSSRRGLVRLFLWCHSWLGSDLPVESSSYLWAFAHRQISRASRGRIFVRTSLKDRLFW